MLPIMEEVAKEAEIPLIHIDIDTDAVSGIKYNIVGTPTVLVLDDDDSVLQTMVGMKNKGSLKAFLGL